MNIQQLTSEKNDSLGPKLSAGPFMGLFGGKVSEGYPFSTKLLLRDHHVVVLRQAAFQD